VLPGVLPLALVVEKLSAGAALMDLPTPRIEPGAPANLVLLDLQASRRVDEHSFHSRSANSWLLGRTLEGGVRMTIAAGRVAYEA
jgi:dihydroorotase